MRNIMLVLNNETTNVSVILILQNKNVINISFFFRYVNNLLHFDSLNICTFLVIFLNVAISFYLFTKIAIDVSRCSK